MISYLLRLEMSSLAVPWWVLGLFWCLDVQKRRKRGWRDYQISNLLTTSEANPCLSRVPNPNSYELWRCVRIVIKKTTTFFY